jgi:hypothetical protein
VNLAETRTDEPTAAFGRLPGVTELEDVPWPPPPIRTERLVLRGTQTANVASMRLAAKLGFIEVERPRPTED